MREIRTGTEIDAPPEAVWAVLTDLPSYPEWNPHVVATEGELREGTEVRVTVKPSGSKRRTIPATVTVVDPPRTLEWVGTAIHPWLFEGRHTFELEPLEEGRTGFVNRERVSGLLVPFVVADDAQRDYDGMNRALAERVEEHAGR